MPCSSLPFHFHSPNCRYPEGHFVRALGKAESKEAEQESLLLEFEVPYRPFGRAVLECLPKEGEAWVVPPKDSESDIWKGREDLRNLIICSIDPPSEESNLCSTCTSIDARLQIVRISMMHCTRGCCRMGISKLVSVSDPSTPALAT